MVRNRAISAGGVRNRTARVRRARVRGGAAGVVASALVALAWAALGVTDDDAAGRRDRGPEAGAAPAVAGPSQPTARGPRGRRQAAEATAPQPEAGRPAAPAAPLAPLAATWRGEVLAGGRAVVQRGALALRATAEGRAQLVVLARDEHPRVRAYALRALGEVRDPDLAPVFSAALADPHPPARDNARWALGRLPAGPARPPTHDGPGGEGPGGRGPERGGPAGDGAGGDGPGQPGPPGPGVGGTAPGRPS